MTEKSNSIKNIATALLAWLFLGIIVGLASIENEVGIKAHTDDAMRNVSTNKYIHSNKKVGDK